MKKEAKRNDFVPEEEEIKNFTEKDKNKEIKKLVNQFFHGSVLEYVEFLMEKDEAYYDAVVDFVKTLDR